MVDRLRFAYQTVTGNSTIPDLRGIFIRGSNNGGSAAGTRADGNQNPDGTLSPGTFTAYKTGAHVHDLKNYVDGAQAQFGGYVVVAQSASSPALGTTANTGTGIGNETAPSNVTINYFIRIN